MLISPVVVKPSKGSVTESSGVGKSAVVRTVGNGSDKTGECCVQREQKVHLP